jgi:hypothetical protein
VGENACDGEKVCDDEIADDDEVAENIGENIGDPIVDERAELENAVGNANELGDAAIVGADERTCAAI